MKFIFNNKEYPSIDGVKKAYYGGQGPVPPGPDYTEPFYVEDISGADNIVQILKSGDNAPTLTIEKSLDGKNWEMMGITSTTIITANIPAGGKLYLRCNASTWGTNIYGYYNKINIIGDCNIGGNIMSLLYGNNFTGNETTFPKDKYCVFYYLFYRNSHILNASDLLLPSTVLVTGCYYSMFDGCTKLTTAPELPASTLNYMCYYRMFGDCYRLNSVKCLATNISAFNCLGNWVYNVPSGGTFVKKAGVEWPSGASGIPSGWTVVEV